LRVRSSGPDHLKESAVSKTRMTQIPLPFKPFDLSARLSEAAHKRAVVLLQQMMIEAIRINLSNKERDDEREDSIHPS
jgi:hypothetical protein